jgi:hypothetical protein
MTWLTGRKLTLNRRARIALNALLIAGFSQAAIGISTLVYYYNTLDYKATKSKIEGSPRPSFTGRASPRRCAGFGWNSHLDLT